MEITKDDVFDWLKKLPVVGEWLEKPDGRVAVVRMAGVIADTSNVRSAGISFPRYVKLLEKAFSVSNLDGVALMLNSPGGSAAQSSLIANLIRRLAKEKEVPVFAFVEDVAASGGYWLACAADEIYVQETSIVGSIGVISASFGLEDFIKRYDIHRRMHTSGKDKSFLDPFSEEKPKDVERLKKLQAGMHESFKEWVKERRGEKLNGKDSELMEGAFWTGKDAIEKGLADEVGDIRGVLQTKFGEKLKLMDFTPDKKWLPFFLSGGSRFPDSHREDWIQAALEVVESRATWNRFGL